MQPYNPKTSATTKSSRTTHVGPYPPLNDAFNMLPRDSVGDPIWARNEETTPNDLAYITTPIPGSTLTAAPPASEENTMYTTDETTIASSPFLKIPGELRNRIYRLYFEDFEEQMDRRFPYSKTKMTPNYLALLHTNRMIRSEAGSVFYKEVAPFHTFTCPTDQPIEAVMLTRIRDVCSLISIRDTQTPISIRCTPSWKDDGFALNSGEDRWRSREIGAFASSALLQVCYTKQPRKPTRDFMWKFFGAHAYWSSRTADHTNVGRSKTGFLVKYRNDGERQGENFVQIEGPVAEVKWDRGWNF